MAEAETELPALDVEALKKLVASERAKDTRFVPMAHHEVEAIIAALERTERLEAALRDVLDNPDEPEAWHAARGLLVPAPDDEGGW